MTKLLTATCHDIAEWLRGLPNTSDVHPLRIVIGDEGWAAASYIQTFRYTSSMDAVTRGHVKAGEEYATESIYAVGTLPRCYIRRNKTVFRREDDTREWYVAGYFDPNRVNGDFAHSNPFGRNFILKPWTDHEPVDRYERFKYDRKMLIVRPVSV